MKVYVYKTSDCTINDGMVREFESLDDCIKTLIKETDQSEYVVSSMNQYYGQWTKKDLDGCSWMVEIYDDYRE